MNTGIAVLSVFLMGLALCGVVAFFFLYDRLKRAESLIAFSSKYLHALKTDLYRLKKRETVSR